MRALQALMMLLGALAVLIIGALPASALTDASSAPPCHETTTHSSGTETPSPAPDKPMKAMDCCVVCVTAPTLRPPDRARLAPPRPAPAVRLTALPAGERPAPEPHPPRPGPL